MEPHWRIWTAGSRLIAPSGPSLPEEPDFLDPVIINANSTKAKLFTCVRERYSLVQGLLYYCVVSDL